jgi:DNA modification methylase
VPPVPVEPVSRTGDLWLLGNHRLLCGDATRAEDVAQLMGSDLATLVWTDPPYGVRYSGRGQSTKRQTLENDDLDPEQLQTFLTAALCAMRCAPGSNAFVCHADAKPGLRPAFEAAFEAAGFVLGATIIWVKQAASMGWQDFRSQHEPILFGWRPGGDRVRVEDRTLTTVWNVSRDGSSTYKHPTQKPVELVRIALKNTSTGGALVVDPFLGSGTTIIAAEMTGRACYGMEIAPQYVDVSVLRWQQFTGREATLDGRTFEEVKRERGKADTDGAQAAERHASQVSG